MNFTKNMVDIHIMPCVDALTLYTVTQNETASRTGVRRTVSLSPTSKTLREFQTQLHKTKTLIGPERHS